MGLLMGLGLAAGMYEAAITVHETMERHRAYGWARGYADSVGKPLLRIGVRRSFLEPPNGDVTLDIDPIVASLPGGVIGDVRGIPFAAGEFGVTFCEHVLEHLHTAEDVAAAVAECVRVADYAVFLCPSPYGIWSSFLCPSHRLRLWFDPPGNAMVVRRNILRTGLGTPAPTAIDDTGRPLRGIGQLLVAHQTAPRVLWES